MPPAEKRAIDAEPAADEPGRASLPSPISPLAVSNAVEQRNAFQQIVEAAAKEADVRAHAAPASAPPRARKSGTQMMANAPIRVASKPSEPAAAVPEPPKKVAQRTVAMAFGTPGSSKQPASATTPASKGDSSRPVHPSVPQQSPFPPAPGYVPASTAGWSGWSSPAAPPAAPYAYPFGYAPGAHVLVTWSNGQRYPATVTQVSGSQCLVVFPDGQQHWIDVQYLAPS